MHSRRVHPGVAIIVLGALPGSYLNVYPAWQLAGLALAGFVIAAAAAVLPGSWAAASTTADALRAE
jgi:putative ABC transport system permease protein